MRDRIAKLINVKTFVTLAMTSTFVYLAATDKIEAREFIVLFTMIISFYFGTQSEKKKE